MNTNPVSRNQEVVVRVQNGWLMLVVLPVLLFLNVAFLAFRVGAGTALPFVWVAALLVVFVLLFGFFSLQPNEARVLVLFGAYKGTVRHSGFHWGNPFYTNGAQTFRQKLTQGSSDRHKNIVPELRARLGLNKISLRARTLNGPILKVNDRRGNPIEIAAVVIWHVEDTAQAMFDIDDYEAYIPTQSESALRHLASLYSYDDGDRDEVTLRSNVDDVSRALRQELQERVERAGVVIDETRLTHLAYAPEIAQAMLRRQQAEAVIAAREKIVHGAVSMVDMALKELAQKDVVHLDDERRAAMVSNLMVVLCGESEVHPVVNTGTLYN